MDQKLRISRSKSSQTNRHPVRTAYELFRTGKATYMEVLIAQQNALDAELDLVRVKRDIHLWVR